MFSLLLIAFLIGHQQQVRSDAVNSIQAEIRQKIVEWDAAFEENFQQLFYDNRRDIGLFPEQSNDRYAELQLFVEIGKIELSQYRRERRALLIAEDIIRRYFIHTNPDPIDWLPKTKSSADYVVSRLIQRAVGNAPVDQENSRKRIYFLVGRYDSTTGIGQYARNYYLKLKNRRALADKADDIVKDKLQGLKTDTLNGMSEDRIAKILESVDNLIGQEESRYDAYEQVPESIERFSRDLELTELEALRRASRDVSAYMDLDELDRVTGDVTMNEVLTYEETLIKLLIQFPMNLTNFNAVAEPGTNDLLQEINWRSHRLNWRFEDFISTEFYDAPQRMPKDHRSYHPMVLSALLAEAYGLIYTAEKRMLQIIEETIKMYFTDMLGDRSKRLSEPLVDNSYLVELILRRSFVHSLRTGFNQTLNLRKQIYLMLNQSEQEHNYLDELARKFYKSLRGKKERYADAIEISSQLFKRYKNEVSLVLPEAHVRDTLAAVDRLITEAVKENERVLLQTIEATGPAAEVDPKYTLRQCIGGYMYEKIMARSDEMKSKGYGYSQDEIDSVKAEDLLRFEDSQSAAPDDGAAIFIA